MNRLIRLTAILTQIQTKKVIKAKEIADRFNISIRTVYRDIRALENAGIPIGSEPGVGYYLVPGYSLPPVMFTDEEANALLLGEKLIEGMSDKSISKEFKSAMYKIKAILDSSSKMNLEFLENSIKVYNPRKKQISHIVKIQKAILGQKKLQIDYYSFYSEENTTRIINPIGLYYYSNSWHLIAFCNLRNDYRDFKVERIKKIIKTSDSFLISKHNSLEEYIKKVRNKFELILVKVKFKNEIAKFIDEQKYYYGFVEETKNTNETEMIFMVSSLDFMARWLISFGKDVKIILPKALEDNIEKLIDELVFYYKKPLENQSDNYGK